MAHGAVVRPCRLRIMFYSGPEPLKTWLIQIIDTRHILLFLVAQNRVFLVGVPLGAEGRFLWDASVLLRARPGTL